jgi:hypothetical protein
MGNSLHNKIHLGRRVLVFNAGVTAFAVLAGLAGLAWFLVRSLK